MKYSSLMKRPAIIIDLDGTLYDARDRQKNYLIRDDGKKDFDGFHAAADNDKPHEWCAVLIQGMRNLGFTVIFSSGRDDKYRESTESWLKRNLNLSKHQYKLFMRPTGDYTADDTMKKAWFHELIEPHYHVMFAVDDRKRVADMWRSVGLTCLHCDEGNF